MTTNITVRQTFSLRGDARRWLRSEHGTEPGAQPNIAYDYTLFTGANFADGYIYSGTVLGKVTATGKWGPYDSAATDGRQTALGLAYDTEKMPDNRSEEGSAALFVHGFVDETKLPLKSGVGGLSAAAKTALAYIIWI